MIIRFPPSPTGNLTIGNIFILINLLILNIKYIKYLIIRIDDTDKLRLKLKFIKNIIKSINYLNINYKKIIFQSNKNFYYNEILLFLYKLKKIYLNKNYKFINFKKIYKFFNFFFFFIIKKKNKIFSIKFKKILIKNLNLIKDFFLLKFDKNFSYNYCSIIDDICFNIDFILRGIEHIKNYLLQISLILVLNKKIKKLIHLPLILNKKKKISKRYKNNIINYKIIIIYFFLKLSLIKFLKKFSINSIKNINLSFNFIKFFKIEYIYNKLMNFNFFNKYNYKKKKKFINLKLKYLIKNLNKDFKNYSNLNKINFSKLKIFQKLISRNLFLNKKNFIYVKKIFLFKNLNFNYSIKYKNLNLNKKHFISIKNFKIFIISLKFKSY